MLVFGYINESNHVRVPEPSPVEGLFNMNVFRLVMMIMLNHDQLFLTSVLYDITDNYCDEM